jgi:hypothetical protein
MFLKYLLLGFLFYFLFKFIFDFIIPVAKTTKQIKKQFDAVREQQQQFYQKQEEPTPDPKYTSKVDKDDDYIEFEEIK